MDGIDSEDVSNEDGISSSSPFNHSDLYTEPVITQSDTDLVMRGKGEKALNAASTPILVKNHLPDLIYEDEYYEEQPQTSNHRLNSEMEINIQHYNKQKQYQELRRERRLTAIDFEGILNLIGGCNAWQIICYIIISIQQIPHAMFNLSVVYMMYQPAHWCKIEGFTYNDVSYGSRDYNWSQISQSHFMFPPPSEGNETKATKLLHSQCYYHPRQYNQYINSSWNQLQHLPLVNESRKCVEWEYDTTVMNVTVVTQFNRICEGSVSWSRAHVHLSYSLGYLIGCILGGILSDKCGRKFAVIIFGITSLIFAAVLASTQEFILFLFIRFLLAVSNEAGDIAAYVFCMEITGTKYRSMVGSLMHAPWALGYAILALIAYMTKSWISIHLITMGVHAVAVIALFFLDESPRWLIIRGTKANLMKAEKIIRKACKLNKSSLPSDLGIIKHAEMKKWQQEHKDPYFFLALFQSGELLGRSIMLFFIWAATALVYYGLVIALSDQSSPGRSLFGEAFFTNNALAGAIELPTLFVCVFLLRNGRKGSLIVTLVGAGVCLLASLIAINYSQTGWSLMLLLAAKCFIQGAFNCLYIFTAELSPTVLRNSAIGLNSMVSRMGSAASGYIAIMSDVTLPIVPMIIFAIFSLIAGALVTFLPETADSPLPDTIWDAVKLHTPQKPCIGLSNIEEESDEEDKEMKEEKEVKEEEEMKE